MDVDLRDVTAADLEGIDAVVHLGALSNDPLGDLNAQLTYDINLEASVRLAQAAKDAGVQRFLFASSCSLYGAGGDDLLDETADFFPSDPYGESKVRVEQAVQRARRRRLLARVPPQRHRVRRRRAACGPTSSSTTSSVTPSRPGKVLLQSDGSPWRPLVHIRDIIAAFIACLDAPREAIHNEAFNVGMNGENYRIRDVAEIVKDVVPGLRGRVRRRRLARHPQLPGRLHEDRPAGARRSSRRGRCAPASRSCTGPTRRPS